MSEETVAPEAGQEPVNVSLGDLQMLHRIVDLASQRGAFRGGELSQVGAVFDKLTNFLVQVEEAQREAEAEQEESAAEETAAEA